MISRLSLFLVLLVVASCASPPPVVYGPPPQSVPPEMPLPPATDGPGEFAYVPEDAERLYPNEELYRCSGMTVSNAPPTNPKGKVENYARLVVVNGVPLVTAPANNACLSSGFGPRWGRNHNGIDITSRPASRVFSGGSGHILEAGYNGGFGLSILIDHGSGVYTRYAHLRHLDDGIVVGQPVYYGMPLGLMGNSGHVTGIHLHYEILTGTYEAGTWGRGLTPQNPFDFPAWVDPYLALTTGRADTPNREAG